MNGDLFRISDIGIGVAVAILVMTGLLLAWERGPGSRPHDPPVDHDAIRQIARGSVVTAAFWAIAGVWGWGGVLVVAAVALLWLGASVVRRRRAGL